MSILGSIRYRLRRGRATMEYPSGPAPALPDRHGGALRVDAARCVEGCDECVTVCPTVAITKMKGQPLELDLGRCIFCTACVAVCPAGAIQFTHDHRIATRERSHLVLGPDREEVRLADALDESMRRMFGRSLRLRQVSAGGCNGCESDVSVLNTVGWDLGRFGIQFVASPRHADGLLITGPVTRNMELALRKTWEAVPAPRIVVAVGACAIAGGPFVDHPQVRNGAASTVPVDLFIAGCPPHPLTILDGLLRMLGKIESSSRPAP
jgi:Ni,Fe-hydrogenase III small subunit/NAD-dependent dihydropyrimidine dehydrogenase PreA subunit